MSKPVFGELPPVEVVMEVDEDGNYEFYALGHRVNITVLDYGLCELNEDNEKEPIEIYLEEKSLHGMTREQLVQKIRKENA